MANSKYSKNYQTIIWDWNGTLFDDAWLCVDIMNGMLQERNLPLLSSEQYAQIFDFPVRDYYARLGFDEQTDPFEKLSDIFIGEYLKRKYECRLRDGAEEIIQKLYRDGRQQLVLSAAKHDHLTRILEYFQLIDYFEDIRGIDNHHADGKLENALRMMQHRQLLPELTLLVGDTLHDWEVAKAIGVDCVLISGGHQSPERLRAAGVNVVKHLSEVQKLLFQ
jgi:phosphoglycolate phosphatase